MVVLWQERVELRSTLAEQRLSEQHGVPVLDEAALEKLLSS